MFWVGSWLDMVVSFVFIVTCSWCHGCREVERERTSASRFPLLSVWAALEGSSVLRWLCWRECRFVFFFVILPCH
jgi:hypothetical protein